MIPYYLDEYKTTIWWSAKCGCTTIKNVIHNIIYKRDVKMIHCSDHSFQRNKLNYTNILIVRNPINRLIACYLDKYELWQKMFFNNKDYSFLEFVTKLQKEFPSTMYEHHFARQFEESFEGIELQFFRERGHRFKFDFVYSLESLKFTEFLQKHFQIKCDSVPFLAITKKNERYLVDKAYEVSKPNLPNANNEFPNYKCFLNESIIQIIKDLYLKDYEYMKQYAITY